MNKKELREQYIKIRDEIQDKVLKDKAIYNNIINDYNYKYSRVVGIYVSTLNEVNTDKIINNALRKGKNVSVPVMLKDYNMDFYQIQSLNDLIYINAFGIREPSKDVRIDNINLMIIPGICFDKFGNRIGYGKGYYDRYLLKHPNIMKIGICYHEQLSELKIDIDKYDIPVDYVITDKVKIKTLR